MVPWSGSEWLSVLWGIRDERNFIEHRYTLLRALKKRLGVAWWRGRSIFHFPGFFYIFFRDIEKSVGNRASRFRLFKEISKSNMRGGGGGGGGNWYFVLGRLFLPNTS